MCTGEVGEGPVVESSVELAVHKAAGRVEVFPGPVVATGARGAQEIREVRAGGAQEIRETDERAGVAREADEFADNFTEEDEFPEGNAAVAFATRAGGAQETGEIFSSKY